MDQLTREGREFLSFLRRESLESPDWEIRDGGDAEFHRAMFPLRSAPVLQVDGVAVPVDLPSALEITDTTFRDGQQAREPYTVGQIVRLYSLLRRLGGPRGKISMCEFFLYTPRDVAAMRECLRLAGTPKVTAWIRASTADVRLFADTARAIRSETGLELDEAGILTSISDYHLFHKYGARGRKAVLDGYLELVEEVLQAGFSCRCHLEDSTRSDVPGVVVPFVRRLMKLAERYGRPVVIRYPDTVGVGVPWDVAALPRSIPKLTHVFRHVCGVPPEWLEFHGHQDLGLGVANATAAWMYGAGRNNGTLLGIGERAGNVPVESLVFTYAGLRGSFDGMDSRVITDIVRYYESELGYVNPEFAPITGRNFCVTRAGVHADGTLKNPETYLPFDTEALLGIAPRVGITVYSGIAGIALWLNCHLSLEGTERIPKDDPRVVALEAEVSEVFAGGRMTSLSDEEMACLASRFFPEVGTPNGPSIRS